MSCGRSFVLLKAGLGRREVGIDEGKGLALITKEGRSEETVLS